MKNILCCLFLALNATMALSQTLQIDTFQYRQNGVNIPFEGVLIRSNDELRDFLRDYDLLPTMFPAVILPRPVIQRVISVGNRQSILADSLTKVSAHLAYQDKLNLLEIQKKDKVIEYQTEFIKFNDQNRQMLNESVKSLNEQLDATRKLASTNARVSRMQKTWAYILGGGMGLGLGAILGVLVAK